MCALKPKRNIIFFLKSAFDRFSVKQNENSLHVIKSALKFHRNHNGNTSKTLATMVKEEEK